MTSPTLAEYALMVRADMRDVKPEVVRGASEAGPPAAAAFTERFTRDAAGRLRNSRGRFVPAGTAIGDSLGESIGRSASDRLGQDRRFSAAGVAAGRKFSKSFASSGDNVLARVASISAARFALVGASAAAAAPGVLQLVGALAPASGALLALPAAMAAVRVSALTLKVATAGVGDAISAGLTGSAKEAEKAMEGLPPAAAKFAGSIVALKKPLDALRASVSEGFFRPLQNDIRPLAQLYLPMLQREMTNLAGPLGGLGERFAQTARSARVFGAVRSLFDQSGVAVVRLRAAIAPLTTALADLISATVPILPRMATGFADAAARASAFVSQASRSGQVGAIFDSAVVALRDLGAILGNVGSIFGSVFRAANAGGNSLLSTMRSLTGEVAAFFRSAQGSAALTSIFGTLSVIGAALRRSLGAVLPAIGASLQALAPAINALAPVAANLVVALAPLLPFLARITATVVSALTPALAALSVWLTRNEGFLKGLVIGIGAFIAAGKVAAIVAGVQAAGGLRAWAASTSLATTATRILTVANMALGAAFRFALGPVGLVIAAVAALVAGLVYAFRHHEGFRALVLRVWTGIKDAAAAAVAWFTGTALPWMRRAFDGIAASARAMWVGTIQPALASMVNFFRTQVAPTISWLWTNVFMPALRGIGIAVRVAWETVIQPAMRFMVAYFRNVLAPTISWLWRNVVVPAFAAIRATIKVAWAVIQVILAAWLSYVRNVLAPGIMWLWRNVVTPAFTAIRATIAGAWSFIKPILAALGDFIRTRVAPGFAVGVKAVSAAWERLRAVARAPVVFVVRSVINPLIAGFNRIAGVFGTDKVDPIAGFERGGDTGRIAGAASARDNRMAKLVNAGGKFLGNIKVATGEFIVNSRDANKPLGRALLEWVNDGMKGGLPEAIRRIGRRPALRPGDGSEGYAFAGGGLVGFVKDVWKSIDNPLEMIKRPIEAALSNIPGGGSFRSILIGMGKKLASGFSNWVGGTGGDMIGGTGKGTLGRAISFVRGQNGKPYGWANAGPGSYDCSGIVSSAWNILHGRSPYSHTFSTGSLPGPFFPKSGRGGPLTAGWSHPGQRGASAGTGHMAGQFAGGMKFESRGGDGVVVGPRATSVGSFAHIGHFSDGGRVKIAKVATADYGKVTLAEGWNLVGNGTGRPEPLSTDAAGGGLHIHIHDSIITSERQFEDMLVKAYASAKRKRRLP